MNDAYYQALDVTHDDTMCLPYDNHHTSYDFGYNLHAYSSSFSQVPPCNPPPLLTPIHYMGQDAQYSPDLEASAVTHDALYHPQPSTDLDLSILSSYPLFDSTPHNLQLFSPIERSRSSDYSELAGALVPSRSRRASVNSFATSLTPAPSTPELSISPLLKGDHCFPSPTIHGLSLCAEPTPSSELQYPVTECISSEEPQYIPPPVPASLPSVPEVKDEYDDDDDDSSTLTSEDEETPKNTPVRASVASVASSSTSEYKPKRRRARHTKSDSTRFFKCPSCPSAFARKHDLDRHHRTHTDERPYPCLACGEGFKRPDARGRHWKRAPGCYKEHVKRTEGTKEGVMRAKKKMRQEMMEACREAGPSRRLRRRPS